MSDHRCHCLEPATWTLRIVPAREVVLTEGHYPNLVLDTMSVDAWATCDEHLAEAAEHLRRRNDDPATVMTLRSEKAEDELEIDAH